MVNAAALTTIKYVLAREGKEIAHLSEDLLQDLAKKGQVRDSDLVLRLGESDWSLAKDREDLAKSLSMQEEFDVAVVDDVIGKMKQSSIYEMMESKQIEPGVVRVWQPGMSEWESVENSEKFQKNDLDALSNSMQDKYRSSTPQLPSMRRPPTPWDKLTRP